MLQPVPQVSIIMPCRNGAKTIADAIRSVQRQTFSDWELVVVDDRSTDKSAEIVRQFAQEDPRVILLRNERPTGFPATPRNVGIEAARGRYIAFLDCDDEWLSTKLARQLPLFSTRNVAVVFSHYGKMDEMGVFHVDSIHAPTFVSYDRLLNGNCIGNLTGTYDTAVVGKVLQKETHHEDYLMWLGILSKGFFAINTNTVEAIYRESGGSVSGGKLRSLQWTWNLYKNELKLPFLKAFSCFLHYSVKGLLKFSK